MLSKFLPNFFSLKANPKHGIPKGPQNKNFLGTLVPPVFHSQQPLRRLFWILWKPGNMCVYVYVRQLPELFYCSTLGLPLPQYATVQRQNKVTEGRRTWLGPSEDVTG